MAEKQEILRQIPQVEKVLQDEGLQRFFPLLGQGIVADVVRNETGRFRERLLAGEALSRTDLMAAIEESCNEKTLGRLQQVINGSGVIIHTNLGRAPLGKDLLFHAAEKMGSYCNLEYHIPSEKRGKRGGFAEELLCHLTGAEDALIVNNNAASVFLLLSEFARGKEVIVSRGELIQIGGGFRIPDIMNQSGAFLVEVGTTNITTIDDMRRAITDETAMILSAHQSNYRIEGFTESPTLQEMASLKRPGLVFARDLGSGNLVSDSRLPAPFEPTVRRELAQGCDLICFSGDKLLGACQAGIILGKRDLVAKLRKNPLMRMMRVDKLTYFLLQETLVAYENSRAEDTGLWKMIFQSEKDIKRKITRCLRRLGSVAGKDFLKRVETRAPFGGGSMPGSVLTSYGLQLNIPGMKPDEISRAMIRGDVPLLGTIIDDHFTIDFFTIMDDEIDTVACRIAGLLQKGVD